MSKSTHKATGKPDSVRDDVRGPGQGCESGYQAEFFQGGRWERGPLRGFVSLDEAQEYAQMFLASRAVEKVRVWRVTRDVVWEKSDG